LGDLDDDDELLGKLFMSILNLYYIYIYYNKLPNICMYVAEMGADFNILEYADPELDNLDCGNKTNILYDLVDDEESNKSSHNKTVSNDKSSEEIETKQSKEEVDDLQRLGSLNHRKDQNSVAVLGIEKFEQDIIHSPKLETSQNVVNAQVIYIYGKYLIYNNLIL